MAEVCCRQQGLKGQRLSGLTVMTIETPQIMKVMTVFPSSPTLLPQGEKGGS